MPDPPDEPISMHFGAFKHHKTLPICIFEGFRQVYSIFFTDSKRIGPTQAEGSQGEDVD